VFDLDVTEFGGWIRLRNKFDGLNDSIGGTRGVGIVVGAVGLEKVREKK